MSCGGPHEVDCSQVLARVYEYLDGETAATDLDEIRHHLDECAPCLREYGLEQVVKALVARCCGAETAPLELRIRVLAQIHTDGTNSHTVSYTETSYTETTVTQSEVTRVEFRQE